MPATCNIMSSRKPSDIVPGNWVFYSWKRVIRACVPCRQTSGWWWGSRSCRSRWPTCSRASPPTADCARSRSSSPFDECPEPDMSWWRPADLPVWRQRPAPRRSWSSRWHPEQQTTPHSQTLTLVTAHYRNLCTQRRMRLVRSCSFWPVVSNHQKVKVERTVLRKECVWQDRDPDHQPDVCL